MMLVYFTQNPDEENNFDISIPALLLSIGLAISHSLLELLQLYFEAQAVGTSLGNYFIICFAGRLGWTPFIENINALGQLI